jgi:ribokinase
MGDNTHIPRILSIGKATQDVFLKSDEFDPYTEGKIAYTHLPLGAKLEVEEVEFATGGNATNVAVTFARQGLHASYMWALGDDPASTSVLTELDAEGVDTTLVVQADRYRAGYSNILLATNGERTILNYRGISADADGKPLDIYAIKDYDWVYPSSLAFAGLGLLAKIIDIAKQHDVKVMLNPAGPELANPDQLKHILEDVDVLCVNKEEMQKLAEGQTLEELVRHGANLCDVVIVSDGPNGVIATDGKTVVRAGMYEDVPVIDRTGAGDAFASGFLSQWAIGKTLEEAIIFASANSTSVVTKVGAKAGILHKGVELHEMPIKSEAF